MNTSAIRLRESIDARVRQLGYRTVMNGSSDCCRMKERKKKKRREIHKRPNRQEKEGL